MRNPDWSRLPLNDHGIGEDAGNELEEDESGERVLLDDHLDRVLESTLNCQETSLPASEFLMFFASINTTTSTQCLRANPKEGNGSREIMTAHRLKCPNKDCTYTSVRAYDVETHHKICNEKLVKQRNKTAEVGIQCPRCAKKLSSQKQLTRHLNDHDYVPRACRIENCPVKTAFTSRNSLRGHVQTEHLEADFNRCTFPGCQIPVAGRCEFGKHMRSHGLKSFKEAISIYPPPKREFSQDERKRMFEAALGF